MKLDAAKRNSSETGRDAACISKHKGDAHATYTKEQAWDK